MITQSKTFRRIAETIVPAAADQRDEEWRALGTTVEFALAQRPPSVRRQLRAFLRILDVLSVLRYARPLRALPPGTRDRFLEGIERSRVLLLRRGLWGLRTLVLMGYYTRPETRVSIGYRANARGWEARR